MHATLTEAIVTAHARFGRPMGPSRVAIFYEEWRRLGRLLGVRQRDLPETWPGFRAYVDEMVEERLEATDAARGVIRSLEDPAHPPVPNLNPRAWRAARIPAVRLSRLGTIGLLPPVLRERLGLTWSRRDELELRVAGRLSRAATPSCPRACAAWARATCSGAATRSSAATWLRAVTGARRTRPHVTAATTVGRLAPVGWTFVYLMVFLKLPILALWIVWWAVKQTPETDQTGEDGGLRTAPPTPSSDAAAAPAAPARPPAPPFPVAAQVRTTTARAACSSTERRAGSARACREEVGGRRYAALNDPVRRFHT